MRGLFSLAAFSLETFLVFTSHFDIIIIDHRSSISKNLLHTSLILIIFGGLELGYAFMIPDRHI